MSHVPRQLDHLVYASPDLELGVAQIETRLGVRLLAGGSHPDWGTRNALLPLGPTTFLEVIGPDPERRAAARPRLFGIDALTAPRLVTWAAKGAELAQLTALARITSTSGRRVGGAAFDRTARSSRGS